MLIVKKYYRKAILVIIPLVILFIFLFSLNNFSNDDNDVITDLVIKDEIINSEDNIEAKVNIKGAVVNPGVYSFNAGDRVIDAIEKSGGLLENADTSVINLSKNLFDEMVIIIYTIDEVKEMSNQAVLVQYVKEECNCPSLQNDACLENGDSDSLNQNGKISINSASIEELQTLDGIGPAKASAIVQYREQYGLFSKVEDIMNVSGIGEAAFAKIKDNITV